MIISLQNLCYCENSDIWNTNFQDAVSEYSQRSAIGHLVQKNKVEVLTMLNSDLLQELQYHAYINNSKYVSWSYF